MTQVRKVDNFQEFMSENKSFLRILIMVQRSIIQNFIKKKN